LRAVDTDAAAGLGDQVLTTRPQQTLESLCTGVGGTRLDARDRWLRYSGSLGQLSLCDSGSASSGSEQGLS